MNELGDNSTEALAAPVASVDSTMESKVSSVAAESAAENESKTKSVVPEDSTHSQAANVDEHDVFDSEKVVSVVISSLSETDTWVTDCSKGDVMRGVMDQLASLDFSKLEDPQVDDMCAVRDSLDGKWFRGKVTSVKPALTVRYIDFGNEAEVANENVVLLSDELKRDAPLAEKVRLVWENSSSAEYTPQVGDILEVRYDGKEADGTIKYQVLSMKEDLDDTDFDDEAPSRGIAETDEGAGGVSSLSKHGDESPKVCDRSNGSETTQDVLHQLDEHSDTSSRGDDSQGAPFQGAPSASVEQLPHDHGGGGGGGDGDGDGDGLELAVSDEQLQEAKTASNLRAEAHATVKELLKELEEKLPGQDEHAQQARLEVEKAMKSLDARLPLQEEVAMQTRLEFQKIMESLDERLQKQQEAALTSMRQMMEKTLSESLRKIDRIQRDLHKLYERTSANSSKQPRRDHPDNQPTAEAERRAEELAYHRNQYNRQPHRNFGPPSSDLPSDRAGAATAATAATAQQHKFDHFASKPGEQRVMSAALAVRQGKDLGHRLAKGSSAGLADSSHYATRGICHLKASHEDQGGKMNAPAEKRSVSFRLQQARGIIEGGDSKIITNSFATPTMSPPSNIISVANLPEAMNIDYLCTLFGLYGNVVRAKMLFQQKGRALVEMADAKQTAAAISILNGTQVFGQTIHLRHCTFEKLNINPLELTNNTAKDYSKLNSYQLNSIRRFKKGVYDPSRLTPPSDTLRVNNILKTVSDDDVKAAFVEKGFVFKNIFFIQGSADKKTAFLTFDSADEALKALHALHNTELRDWMPLKISFGTQKRQ